jgi:hypothetical protein
MRISGVSPHILHDFPRQAQQSIALRERLRSELTAPTPDQVALEARKSESAGARTGIIDVQMTEFHDGDDQQRQAQGLGARHRELHPLQQLGLECLG